jgi:hypothetical protein
MVRRLYMSNLAEIYNPCIPYEQLKIGMKLQISEAISRTSSGLGLEKIGEVVTIVDLKRCLSYNICPYCTCNRKIIDVQVESNKRIILNCSYYQFKGINGKKIYYG